MRTVVMGSKKIKDSIIQTPTGPIHQSLYAHTCIDNSKFFANENLQGKQAVLNLKSGGQYELKAIIGVIPANDLASEALKELSNFKF